MLCPGCGEDKSGGMVNHHWYEDASCKVRKEKMICDSCNAKLSRSYLVSVLGVNLPEARAGMCVDEINHLLPPWEEQRKAIRTISGRMADNEFFQKQTIWLNQYRAVIVAERKMMLEALVNQAIEGSSLFNRIKKEVYENGKR